MNLKSIAALLIVLSIMGVASAAVIYEYNNTATARMTIEKPNSQDIETLVSSDGVNFSESITLENVSPGDTIVLTFSHENVGENNFMFGTIEYEISCPEGLEFNGPCKGSIHDFYDSEPGFSIQPIPTPIPDDECANVECGIIHTTTWGDSYPVNSKDYVYKLGPNAAEILPWNYAVFDDVEYSVLTLTFVDGAYGTYEVSGTVETVFFIDIPREHQDKINETIEV